MAIADELDKLAKLHDSGDLSDDEYAQAKDAALRAAGAQPQSGDGPGFIEDMFGGGDNSLGTAANRYVSFQMVMGGIGLIVFLVVACAMMSQFNNGARLVPYP
jgi:hypothetical protein